MHARRKHAPRTPSSRSTALKQGQLSHNPISGRLLTYAGRREHWARGVFFHRQLRQLLRRGTIMCFFSAREKVGGKWLSRSVSPRTSEARISKMYVIIPREDPESLRWPVRRGAYLDRNAHAGGGDISRSLSLSLSLSISLSPITTPVLSPSEHGQQAAPAATTIQTAARSHCAVNQLMRGYDPSRRTRGNSRPCTTLRSPPHPKS